VFRKDESLKKWCVLSAVGLPILLFTAGCGGGSAHDAGVSSVADSSGGMSQSGSGYIVSGRVSLNKAGVDNVPVFLTSATAAAMSGPAATSGYVEVTTSGGGAFSAQVPWQSVAVMASNEQYIGYTQADYTSNVRLKLSSRASGGENVPLEPMSQYAVPNPPTDFPPSDFDNSTPNTRPRIFPLLLAELVLVLEDAIGISVATHFAQDFLERDVSLEEVFTTLEQGEAFYDPKYDTLVLWKDGIALSLTKNADRLISVIKGMDKPTSRWLPWSRARLKGSYDLKRSERKQRAAAGWARPFLYTQG